MTRRTAFSTLGLPGAPIDEIVRTARQHGFHGVELRAGPDEAVHVGMPSASRAHVRHHLDAAGIDPLAVASYVKVADLAVPDDDLLADAQDHLRLAADLGAGYLRVFPGGDVHGSVDDRRVGRRLAQIADLAPALGVTVAWETHDSHRSARRSMAVLDQPGCGHVVAIWDVLHTWLAGESPAESARLLDGRLGYVQVKDVRSATDLTPLPPGEGVLPLGEVARELARTSYDGWISWEYERAWFPEQPALGEHAAEVRRRIEGCLFAR